MGESSGQQPSLSIFCPNNGKIDLAGRFPAVRTDSERRRSCRKKASPPDASRFREAPGAAALARHFDRLPKPLLFGKTIRSSLCPYYNTVKFKMLVLFHKNFDDFYMRKSLSNTCQKVEVLAAFRNCKYKRAACRKTGGSLFCERSPPPFCGGVAPTHPAGKPRKHCGASPRDRAGRAHTHQAGKPRGYPRGRPPRPCYGVKPRTNMRNLAVPKPLRGCAAPHPCVTFCSRKK